MYTQALETRLRECGKSVTAPRQAVFTALAHRHPLDMSELLAICKEHDRASIYRTVALFESLNIVTRIHSGWKYALELSDMFSDHHHHITCIRCGQITPLPEDQQLESVIARITRKARYLPRSHQLEIRAICDHCQAQLET